MARTISIRFRAIALILAALPLAMADAQQAGINTPLHSSGHSFYENIGVRWGIQGNGWFFNFGGPAPQPGFGGFDPNAQANFGASFGNGSFFQLTAGQGSSTTFGSQSPSVTVPNGGMGFFSDTAQRPFVTGLVPVVGSEPKSPVRERIERLQSGETPAPSSDRPEAKRASATPPTAQSSAERGDLSVADIKALQLTRAAAERAEIDALIDKARAAEAAGQLVSARIYYQSASRRTTGDEQQELLKRARALERK